MHTQDLFRHGSLRVGINRLLGSRRYWEWPRIVKSLVLGLIVLMAGAVAQGTPIIRVEFAPAAFVTLSGGQSLSVYNGPASGLVNQIFVSFFFSPATEGAQKDSRASDFSVIVIAPGGQPEQWGGADPPFQSLYSDGVQVANHVANWSFHGPGSGSPNFDLTYQDSQRVPRGLLGGDGNWQVLIMNGYAASQPVIYQDVRIVLSGPTSVPEGFGSWESLLCLAGMTGLFGVARARPLQICSRKSILPG